MERGEVGQEVRQEGIPLRNRPTLLQGLQQGRRDGRGLPSGRIPEAPLRRGHRRLGHRDLGQRQDRHGRFRPQGSLRLGIEPSEGGDLVPEELDPHRMGGLRRKAIQDAAPDRELARLRHLADPTVARRREGAEQIVAGDDPLRVERERGGGQRRRPDRSGEGRSHRRHQDGGLPRCQPMQRLDAPRPGLEVGLALRQEGHAAAQEEFQVGRQRRRHLVGPGEDQERPPGPRVARRQGQGARCAVQAVEADLAGRGEILQEVRQLGFAPEELRQHGLKGSGQLLSRQRSGAGKARRWMWFSDAKTCGVLSGADG